MGIYSRLLDFIRFYKINKENRKRLKNLNPTIIASNCNGTFIYHDLGLKFNSPTINLFFYPSDFLKFVNNLEYYLSLEIKECDIKENYPVGKLGDIKIYFMHYKSFNEAKKLWDKRKSRVNYNNIFIMMTDRDGCTLNNLVEFDKLPYKNKVVFTSKRYNNIKSSFYIEGFENKKEVGILSDYKHNSVHRYIDDFDYVDFLNKR